MVYCAYAYYYILLPIEDHPKWKDFYPDAEEVLANYLPKSEGLKVQMTVSADSDHAHNLM
jgi:hypothetical protein